MSDLKLTREQSFELLYLIDNYIPVDFGVGAALLNDAANQMKEKIKALIQQHTADEFPCFKQQVDELELLLRLVKVNRINLYRGCCDIEFTFDEFKKFSKATWEIAMWIERNG